MTWTVGYKKDLNSIVTYLLKSESESIQALSLFISGDAYRFPRSHNVIPLIKKENGEVKGTIIITSRGLIYPKLTSLTRNSTEEKKLLIKLIATINVRIHGVIGLKDDVDFLDSIIFRRIKGKNSYLLLKRESEDMFNPDNSHSIRIASIFDLNRLSPMEIEYQKEEVLLSPSDLNRAAIIENFKSKIVNNTIYFLTEKNLPLSKAGTSYRSKNYILIGGVFTWKKMRNRGLSAKLLKFLINDQLKKGYKGALFVKDANKSALHLYNKLGFESPKAYTINYYHR